RDRRATGGDFPAAHRCRRPDGRPGRDGGQRRGRVRRATGDRLCGTVTVKTTGGRRSETGGAGGFARPLTHRWASLHLGSTGSGPDYSVSRRTAVIGFSALAVGTLRILVHRGVLARVPQGRFFTGHARLCGAAPSVRLLTDTRGSRAHRVVVPACTRSVTCR